MLNNDMLQLACNIDYEIREYTKEHLIFLFVFYFLLIYCGPIFKFKAINIMHIILCISPVMFMHQFYL